MKINFSKNKVDNNLLDKVAICFDEAVDYLQIPCKDLEVNIAIVGSREIKKLNAEFRNVDKVTDVLSFPFLLEEGKTGDQEIISFLTKENFKNDVNPDTGNIVVGDLYICFDKVKKQAREYGTGIEREFTYLALHGLLHLLGFDHMVDEDKVVMRKKEEEILNLLWKLLIVWYNLGGKKIPPFIICRRF